MRTLQDAKEVKDHWWWRSGWQSGRHFYACHITFDNQPSVQSLVTTYQKAVTDIPGLDLIPQMWLHLTMQGIGFTDEISNSEINEITERISDNLARLTQPIVTFARPVVRPEAILIPATPVDALDDVRRHTHEAIREVIGAERAPDADLSQSLETYRPHVSVAYINKAGSAEPYIEALHSISHDPVTVSIRTVSVLTFHRDNKMYEWTRSIPVVIGR
jgi:2'-5' RNA ligase